MQLNDMTASKLQKCEKIFFTLIELLVVVFILGTMTMIILPSFENAEFDSKTEVASAELRLIQKAFLKFYYDVAASDTDLETIFDEGGYLILFSQTGGTMNFPTYDPEYSKGWRGPYIENEGTTATPTVNDPWGNSYQFLDPGPFVKDEVILITTGPDGVADTSASATVAAGDDIMVKLFL